MNKPILYVVAALAAVAGIFWFAASRVEKSETEKVQRQTFVNQDRLVREHSPQMGPDDAIVTLVEFLDPECEACGAMHPIVKQLMQEYEGKVRLVVRYMPLHGNSVYAANVLEIARKEGQYWQALEELFSKQREWASHHAPKPELIEGYMNSLGVDISNINSGLLNDVILKNIAMDREDGKALGVQKTPTFFVNGIALQQIGYDPIRGAIEEALEKSE